MYNNIMISTKTILKRLIIYIACLTPPILLAVCGVFRIFPFNELETLYYIVISVIFIRYIYERVVGGGVLKRLMMAISILMLFLFCARFAKYKFFHEAETIKRFCWYLYYIPRLLIPQLTFLAAINIDRRNRPHISKRSYLCLGITIILIALVLTNDSHQLVFGFNPGFENWDNDYSYGPMLFGVLGWEYLFYILSFVVMIFKCRVSKVVHLAWLALVPWVIGLSLAAADILGYGPEFYGYGIMDATRTLGFTVAFFLDICMNVGFIPTNRSHRLVITISSIAAQITDNSGKAIYASKSARKVAEEWMTKPEPIIEGDTLIRRVKIRNGYGFWEQDISDINRVNEELLDIQERLREEGELTRLENELKEKQAKINSRTKLYSRISEGTKRESAEIIKITNGITETSTLEEVKMAGKRICIFGAFIKRYANLMLLAENNRTVNIMELGLAILESLKYLNSYGITGDYMGNSKDELNGNQLLAMYEVFVRILEDNLDSLKAVYVRLDFDGCLKIILEGVYVNIEEALREKIEATGVSISIIHEDQVSYVRLKAGKEIVL